MKVYKAKSLIQHGDKNGDSVTYKAGDEVPAGLAKQLPSLVEVIEYPDPPKQSKEPRDPNKPDPNSKGE